MVRSSWCLVCMGTQTLCHGQHSALCLVVVWVDPGQLVWIGGFWKLYFFIFEPLPEVRELSGQGLSIHMFYNLQLNYNWPEVRFLQQCINFYLIWCESILNSLYIIFEYYVIMILISNIQFIQNIVFQKTFPILINFGDIYFDHCPNTNKIIQKFPLPQLYIVSYILYYLYLALEMLNNEIFSKFLSSLFSQPNRGIAASYTNNLYTWSDDGLMNQNQERR